VLRRIFGPKKEEEIGGLRKLYNEGLHNLCLSSNVVKVIKARRMRWEGHVACRGDKTNMYQVFVRKCQGKRPTVYVSVLQTMQEML
jgi:hypothetical protein